jgi:hypothetical protein
VQREAVCDLAEVVEARDELLGRAVAPVDAQVQTGRVVLGERDEEGDERAGGGAVVPKPTRTVGDASWSLVVERRVRLSSASTTPRTALWMVRTDRDCSVLRRLRMMLTRKTLVQIPQGIAPPPGRLRIEQSRPAGDTE